MDLSTAHKILNERRQSAPEVVAEIEAYIYGPLHPTSGNRDWSKGHTSHDAAVAYPEHTDIVQAIATLR